MDIHLLPVCFKQHNSTLTPVNASVKRPTPCSKCNNIAADKQDNNTQYSISTSPFGASSPLIALT